MAEDTALASIASGRGELHLSVPWNWCVVKGFEFEVGRPQVVTIEEDGITKEPIENYIEVGSEFVEPVSQELGMRRAGNAWSRDNAKWSGSPWLHIANTCTDWIT